MKINNYKNLVVWLILAVFWGMHVKCKRLVELQPPVSSVSEENVFADDGTAVAALTGMYISMSSATNAFTGSGGISFLTGLSSDEFTLNSAVTTERLVRHYQNELIADGILAAGSEQWDKLYNLVFKCNAAIEGLTGSNRLTPAVKTQLLGEAKFLRAFYYFYLVNLFGEVPLLIDTDYKKNTLAARAAVADVYARIIADLKEAEGMLSADYLDPSLLKTTTERVRPTKWAAAALLARVYLYKGDFSNAESQAAAVIGNSSFFSLPTLNNVFLKNSKEAIWQLQPTQAGLNTQDAVAFILTATGPGLGPNKSLYFSPQLLGAIEADDQRMVNGNWVNSVTVSSKTYVFPFKYKVHLSNSEINSSTGTSKMAEYLMVLRIGEQYLIRAEARAQLNKLEEARADLNAIRHRAGLPDIVADTKEELLSAILHERQVELFSEWGHRWFDLKRSGTINTVMSVVAPAKGGVWQNTDALYPLPFADLNKAPNLIQNDGYW